MWVSTPRPGTLSKAQTYDPTSRLTHTNSTLNPACPCTEAESDSDSELEATAEEESEDGHAAGDIRSKTGESSRTVSDNPLSNNVHIQPAKSGVGVPSMHAQSQRKEPRTHPIGRLILHDHVAHEHGSAQEVLRQGERGGPWT